MIEVLGIQLISVAVFPVILAFCRLGIIVEGKLDARLEVSGSEYPTFDPPCIKAIQGHLKSSEVSDL